jgi:hypothetical protein
MTNLISAENIRQALQCNNPSCACHRPTGHVHCPAHDLGRQDKTPSLSLTEKDGKVLFHCFNGCLGETLLDALRERGLWSAAKKGKGNISSGKRCNRPTVPGLTLEELAKAKGFQIDGPKGLMA